MKRIALALVACLALGACSDDTTPQDAAVDAAGDAGRPDAATGDAAATETGADGPAATCASSCHGSATSEAPPVSTKGESTTTARGVGAHQQHLKSSSWHAQVLCTDCHVVPKTAADKGHLDTSLPAELTFSSLAMSDGASPVWDGTTTTCSGGYCHGATLSGGAHTSPKWTQVDGTQSTCSGCHGMPPTKDHPTSTSCVPCHKAVVDSAGKIIAPKLHIDGKVAYAAGHAAGYTKGSVHGPDFLKDPGKCKNCHGATLTGGKAFSCESCHPQWKTDCDFCHGGTDNTTGAPPTTVDGKTAKTVPGVGQHTAHVAAYDCGVCHDKPTDALSAGHIDSSPAEVKLSGVAGASASYDQTTNQCSSVYCHGDGTSSGSGSASWVGTLAGGCSACHDDETDGVTMKLSASHGTHVITKKLACSICHGCVVNASKVVTDKSKHADGKRDVCGIGVGWDASSSSCTPVCHVTKKW